MIAIKAVDEASGVMDKIRASTSILGSAFQSMGGAVGSAGNVMQGFAAGGIAGAAVSAIGEVAKGLKWAIGEAGEAEQAIKNLSIAVEKSGTSWESVKEGTNAALSEMQKFTTYSDEQLAAALQQLLTFGMSYDEAMSALGTTVDLAAAKQIDLGSAATILGKAFMGNTAILARYGIDITTGKEATVAFKDAVDKVGDALSTAQKTGGVLDGFKDSIGDMGVKINDADGKMRDFKDIATDLVSALAEGRIDTKEYGQTLADLGIDVSTLNLKAADFTGVMAELNEKFGGTAQEQAKTYAGTQERLKNAMSDLGEKIGGMVLPALAGMTEAMIPVVDWLGKGVDAVGNWLTEIGKMPEVQAVVTIVQDAFDGLWKAMEDFWGFLAETFGPVLQELGGALREVFDALAPIGEAFAEVWAAITGGQEGGDWLKDLLKFVAEFIREVVVPAIKEAVPVIRGFAEAFKAAADFALPIITGIKDAVVGFINVLKDAFYGFYTWLVGGSLWQDMWNELLKVASGVGNLLKGILEGAFELWKGVFNIGMDALKTILTTGFGLAFAAVQTVVSGAVSILSGLIGGIQTLIQGATKDWGDLVSAVSTTLGTLRDTISGFWTWTTTYWKTNVNDIVTATQLGFGQIQQAVTQLKEIETVVASVARSDVWWEIPTKLADIITAMVRMLSVDVIKEKLDDMGNTVTKWRIAEMPGGGFGLISMAGGLLRAWEEVLSAFHWMTNDYLYRTSLRFESFFVHGVFPRLEQHGKELTDMWQAYLTTFWNITVTETEHSGDRFQMMKDRIIAIATELDGTLTPSWRNTWMGIETILSDIYTNLMRRSTELWTQLTPLFSVGLAQLSVTAKESLTQVEQAFKDSFSRILTIFQLPKIEKFWETVTTALQGGMDVRRIVHEQQSGGMIAVDEATNQVVGGLAAIIWNWANALEKIWMDTWDWCVSIGLRFESMFNHAILPILTTGLGQVNDSWQMGLTTFWNIAVTETTHSGDRFQMMAGRILSIMTPFGETLQAVWTTLTDALKATWDACWQVIEGKFTITSETINAGVTSWYDTISGTFTEKLAYIYNLWQTSWTQIMSTTTNICSQIMAGLISWYQLIQDTTTGSLALLTETFQNALSGIYDMFTSTFSGMASAAQSYMSSIAASVANAFAQVQAAAAEMKAQMVTGSIWPDMLEEMQSQTYSALGNIASAFEDMSLAVPATIPYASATPSTSAPAASTSLAGATESLVFTIPITVTLDGEVISRQVERRTIQRVNLSGRRVD